MKIDRCERRQANVPTQPFRKLLQEARASLPAKPVGAATKPSVATAAAIRAQGTQARGASPTPQLAPEAHAQSRQLASRRAEAVALTETEVSQRVEGAEATLSRTEERLIALITRELNQPHPPTPASQALPAATTPSVRAAQAAALIEQIERFVRSQRPGLALTLNNSLGARVEIERLGPREVAVKLVGHRGPPAPEAVSRVREALRERGLRVGALSVA
jgi:hypothetical protein